MRAPREPKNKYTWSKPQFLNLLVLIVNGKQGRRTLFYNCRDKLTTVALRAVAIGLLRASLNILIFYRQNVSPRRKASFQRRGDLRKENRRCNWLVVNVGQYLFCREANGTSILGSFGSTEHVFGIIRHLTGQPTNKPSLSDSCRPPLFNQCVLETPIFLVYKVAYVSLTLCTKQLPFPGLG